MSRLLTAIVLWLLLSILLSMAGCAKMCEAGGRSLTWFGSGVQGAGNFIQETSATP